MDFVVHGSLAAATASAACCPRSSQTPLRLRELPFNTPQNALFRNHYIITNQKISTIYIFIIYYLLSPFPSNFPSCIFQSNVL